MSGDYVKRPRLTDEEIMRNNNTILDNKLDRLEKKIKKNIGGISATSGYNKRNGREKRMICLKQKKLILIKE